MNEIFKPSIVISVGPSAKKALNFLDDMLLDTPKYLRDVIELYSIDKLENCKLDIQRIIDEKLLCARSINKLVDLGYKIRTENTSNININIFLYWDVYDSKFPVNELIEILFNLNYCVVDREKNYGVTLFVLPMLDKEWLYSEDAVIGGINKLKSSIELISDKNNMININSKMYITHTVANDGLRVKKEELEYIISIVTYLTILPSEEPLLSVYNKRLLKNEGEFKVGTIGISSLTIFKDKIKEEFSSYLINDLVDHAIKFEDNLDFTLYSSYDILNGKKVFKHFGENMPIKTWDKPSLIVPEKYDIKLQKNKIWNRNAEMFEGALESLESNIKNDYLKQVKKIVTNRKKILYDNSLKYIDKDLKSIVSNYSLLEGKNFLKSLKEKINNETLEYLYENKIDTINYKDELKERINNYPNFYGSIFKILLIICFNIYFLLLVMNHITFLQASSKIIISVILLFSILFFISIEYISIDKNFIRFIDRCIENIYLNEGKLLKKYVGKQISDYYDFIKEHIEMKIKGIDEAIENLKKMRVNTEDFKNRSEDKIEVLVTDLFNYNDRRKFYESKKCDIWAIYSRFIGQLNNYDELKEIKVRDYLKEFSNNITAEYTNIDFYEYIRIKWEDNLENEVSDWIDKALIKSKELLQYNNDYQLESHKLFIGSGEFIKDNREIIMNKLNRYKLINVEDKDIYTNCISLVNLTLGINLSKITPFLNVEGGKIK